jgi:hypothetical protein
MTGSAVCPDRGGHRLHRSEGGGEAVVERGCLCSRCGRFWRAAGGARARTGPRAKQVYSPTDAGLARLVE